MEKCWEIIDNNDGKRYGMFKNRADAEEMCLVCAEEASYLCFLWEVNIWGTDVELALDFAYDAQWRIEIEEYNLF